MPDNNKPPQIAEGNAYFLMNLNTKTGEISCSYSNPFDALALHQIGQTMLEKMKRDMLGMGQPAIAIPGVSLPNFDALKTRNKA